MMHKHYPGEAVDSIAAWVNERQEERKKPEGVL
jgi:hypothetical protein